MARITDMRDIPLEDLEIGMSQVRTRQLKQGITELAESIRKQGLLEPIMVCPGSEDGKYEILTGQRRYLAHVELKAPTIKAVVLDKRADEIEAKVISLTENMMRRDLNRQDLIDACTFLYKKYDSVKAVAEETGLPYHEVREYVKFDRLSEPLKEMVTKNEVNLKTALRAQTAAEQFGGDDVIGHSTRLAKEMAEMTGPAQARAQEVLAKSAGKSIDEAIEAAKSGARVTQVVVTLGERIHADLQRFADDEGTSQDDAAVSLITEGLSEKGYSD